MWLLLQNQVPKKIFIWWQTVKKIYQWSSLVWPKKRLEKIRLLWNWVNRYDDMKVLWAYAWPIPSIKNWWDHRYWRMDVIDSCWFSYFDTWWNIVWFNILMDWSNWNNSDYAWIWFQIWDRLTGDRYHPRLSEDKKDAWFSFSHSWSGYGNPWSIWWYNVWNWYENWWPLDKMPRKANNLRRWKIRVVWNKDWVMRTIKVYNDTNELINTFVIWDDYYCNYIWFDSYKWYEWDCWTYIYEVEVTVEK